MRKKSISVVVPVFRSSEILKQFYERTSVVLSQLTNEWEIIFVDDCSADNTYAVMQSLRALDDRVKIISFSKNMGQQHSTLCGIKKSKYEIIFTIDDDLQCPPESIPDFLNKIEEGFELVIGKILSNKKHSSWRNLGSSIHKFLVSQILKKPKHIELSSYRCMTRKVAELLSSFEGAHVYLPSFLFTYVPVSKIANIPFSHHERYEGKSNYTIIKLFKLFSYLIFNHSQIPLRVMTIWGMFLSFASLCFAGFIFIQAFTHNIKATGWSSLAVLISFLSGNILLCLGILGEYIGRVVSENRYTKQFPIFEEEI